MNEKIEKAIHEKVLFEEGAEGQIYPLFDDEDGVAYFQLLECHLEIGLWEGEVVGWNEKTRRKDRSWVRITTKGVDFHLNI